MDSINAEPATVIDGGAFFASPGFANVAGVEHGLMNAGEIQAHMVEPVTIL